MFAVIALTLHFAALDKNVLSSKNE